MRPHCPTLLTLSDWFSALTTLFTDAVHHSRQAFRQQQLAIESATASALALRRMLDLTEHLSATTLPDVLQHSDPQAADILRFFLDLSPAEIARLKQDPYPTVLDQPNELARLAEQLASWAELGR